jgi:DNA-3-methyladenine glycosylase I
VKTRCAWVSTDLLYLDYHDNEWGVPVRDDRELFEHLVLDGAQAGLSWLTILKKREAYRQAFDHFDPEKMARYGPKKIEALLQNPGIVRNRLKIQAAVSNARAYLDIQEATDGFADYIWQFVDGRRRINAWRTLESVPTETDQSRKMSRELKRWGFRFVGPTICYAYMQAVGLVHDHTTDCFRYSELLTDR